MPKAACWVLDLFSQIAMCDVAVDPGASHSIMFTDDGSIHLPKVFHDN